MMAIIKINDTTVADVREARTIFSKTQLTQRKKDLEEQLAITNELLAAFN